MTNFQKSCNDILNRLDREMFWVENNPSRVDRAIYCCTICASYLPQLQRMATSQRLPLIEDEVFFFKEIWAEFLTVLFFYQEMYAFCAVYDALDEEQQNRYYDQYRREYDAFEKEHNDFARYINHFHTYLDSLYFTRLPGNHCIRPVCGFFDNRVQTTGYDVLMARLTAKYWLIETIAEDRYEEEEEDW